MLLKFFLFVIILIIFYRFLMDDDRFVAPIASSLRIDWAIILFLDWRGNTWDYPLPGYIQERLSIILINIDGRREHSRRHSSTLVRHYRSRHYRSIEIKIDSKCQLYTREIR